MRKAVVAGLVALFVMMMLAACGGTPEPVEVQVTLTDFGYESSLTTFEVGQPYRFVVTNEGALNHEFMISEPMMMMDGEMEEMSEEEHHELAVLEIEEDELPPGATQEIEFTFEEHHTEEELEFACHVEGHYEAGMHMPIEVVNP